MKTIATFFVLSALILAQGCVKNDYIDNSVEPTLRIVNKIDSLKLNTSFQFNATYYNNVGKLETIVMDWVSSDTAVIKVSKTGLATAVKAGKSIVTSTYQSGGKVVKDNFSVTVGQETVVQENLKKGMVKTTSSYALTGDFTLKQVNSDLLLSLAANYNASTSLPGLYVYLSNNPTTIVGALEIGKVTVFKGAHTYTIPNKVGVNDYKYVLYFCKPFNVKVGDGLIE